MISKRQHGFSMIEVLVAIVVVSLGMLGMAALHAVTLRNTNSSYYRSIAISLAQDMADRMRSNLNAQSFNNSTSAYASDTNTTTAPTIPTTVSAGVVCPEATSICPSNTIAAYDYYHFWTDVHNLLPNGIAIVCSTTTPNEASPNPLTDTHCPGGTGSGTANPDNRLLTIKIYWRDDRNTSNWILYSLVARI